jgi:hypothetical protein
MQQELRTVAIALAKKVLHPVGADTSGKMLWRKHLPRNALDILCGAAASGVHQYRNLWWDTR